LLNGRACTGPYGPNWVVSGGNGICRPGAVLRPSPEVPYPGREYEGMIALREGESWRRFLNFWQFSDNGFLAHGSPPGLAHLQRLIKSFNSSHFCSGFRARAFASAWDSRGPAPSFCPTPPEFLRLAAFPLASLEFAGSRPCSGGVTFWLAAVFAIAFFASVTCVGLGVALVGKPGVPIAVLADAGV
jgi:hypothetical protein